MQPPVLVNTGANSILVVTATNVSEYYEGSVCVLLPSPSTNLNSVWYSHDYVVPLVQWWVGTVRYRAPELIDNSDSFTVGKSSSAVKDMAAYSTKVGAAGIGGGRGSV